MSTRATSASARAGSGTWCSTSMMVARSRRPSSIGSASRSPRRRSMLSQVLEPLSSGLQHRGGRVDRDDARHERRERGADLAGSAAEIADGPVSAAPERRERGEMKSIAEQFVADAIPLAGRRGEELLRPGAALAERCLQAALILGGGRRAADLLADDDATAVVRPHRARASSCRRCWCPRRAPTTQPESASALRCRLTVDCGSCITRAELRHRQLAPVEEQQQPAPRGVGQRGQVVEDGRRARSSSVKPDDRIARIGWQG